MSSQRASELINVTDTVENIIAMMRRLEGGINRGNLGTGGFSLGAGVLRRYCDVEIQREIKN